MKSKYKLTVHLYKQEFLVDFKNNCTPAFDATLSLVLSTGAAKEINMEDFGTDMKEVANMFNEN